MAKPDQKFAQLKEHLERTYGKGTFVSKAWLRAQVFGRRSVAAKRDAGDAVHSRGSASSASSVSSVTSPQPGSLAALNATPTPTELALAQAQTLEQVRAVLGDCPRCKLCETRTHIVYGEGNPTADLMFIGEGPGEQEDEQGRPFVGKAGQLLDKIIEAMGLKRSDVYIANVVKCRPPSNRVPEPDEVGACEPFLFRQIEIIKPKVIVALGGTALKALLHNDTVGITRARGHFTEYRGTKLMPTFHPAYLLRNPESKREVWDDMKKVKVELGLK